jgi:hypothetical protein
MPRASGAVIVDWFYDAAVSGADPIEVRPGFAELFCRLDDDRADAVVGDPGEHASPAISWSRKSSYGVIPQQKVSYENTVFIRPSTSRNGARCRQGSA